MQQQKKHSQCVRVETKEYHKACNLVRTPTLSSYETVAPVAMKKHAVTSNFKN